MGLVQWATPSGCARTVDGATESTVQHRRRGQLQDFVQGATHCGFETRAGGDDGTAAFTEQELYGVIIDAGQDTLAKGAGCAIPFHHPGRVHEHFPIWRQGGAHRRGP